jgi:hypothetical protein
LANKKMIKYLRYSCIVFLLALGFSAHVTHAAVFATVASKSQVEVGGQATVSVGVATNASINAVSGTIRVPAQFSIQSVSYDASIIDIWTTKPTVSGQQISFEGIVLNPGYQGAFGSFFSIVVKAQTVGDGTLTFVRGSLLANDGKATNITGAFPDLVLIALPGRTSLDTSSPKPAPVATSSTVVDTTPAVTPAAVPLAEPYLSAPAPESVSASDTFTLYGVAPDADSVVVTDVQNQRSLISSFLSLDSTTQVVKTRVLPVQKDKTFIYTPELPLVPGFHEITIRSTRVDGSTSSSVKISAIKINRPIGVTLGFATIAVIIGLIIFAALIALFLLVLGIIRRQILSIRGLLMKCMTTTQDYADRRVRTIRNKLLSMPGISKKTRARLSETLEGVEEGVIKPVVSIKEKLGKDTDRSL